MIENHLVRNLRDKDLGCPHDCPFFDDCDGDECELLEEWENEQWVEADRKYEEEKIYGEKNDKEKYEE